MWSVTPCFSYLDAKLKLEKEKPVLYSKVKDIWNLHHNHMRKNVQSKYVFMLQCCVEEGCVHPVCKEGLLQNETWHPGGPSPTFLPLPNPDINRPFNGVSCNECGTQCNGLYMKYEEALARFTEHRKTDFVQPPSVVILKTCNKYKSIPPRALVLLETTQCK